ncbi:MAG: hypothetical protein M3509_11345 [Chloroflexota bacterium]|nr:hypothetical protein [Chloroflexota bacterium]
MTTGLLLLDSCTVINVFATRRMSDVLIMVPGTVAIVDRVSRESQFVRRAGSGDDADERDPVDLTAMTASGQLTVLSSTNEGELLTYLDFTLDVDDGEAMTAALAIHRNATVATDDRKAIRLLVARAVPILSTQDLVHDWCDRTNLPRDEQRQALLNIRERARYEPRLDHPHRSWWEATIGAGDR